VDPPSELVLVKKELDSRNPRGEAGSPRTERATERIIVTVNIIYCKRMIGEIYIYIHVYMCIYIYGKNYR